MHDFHSISLFILMGFIIAEMPIIIAIWLGGHRHNLRKLADGESVIVIPDKKDKYYVWRNGVSTMIHRPYFGPMNYLGATASAGMLRRWSIMMSIFSATIYLCAYAMGDQCWFPATGFFLLLLATLYWGDLKYVSRKIHSPVKLFIAAHVPLGYLMLSNISLKKPGEGVPVMYGSLASFVLFVLLIGTPVPKDDLLNQIKDWKRAQKLRKRKRRFFVH